MTNIIQQGDNTDYGIYQYVCDTLEDVKKLTSDAIKAGSSAICLEDSSVWMLGGDGQWHELGV